MYDLDNICLHKSAGHRYTVKWLSWNYMSKTNKRDMPAEQTDKINRQQTDKTNIK